jgi:hypothetical protein
MLCAILVKNPMYYSPQNIVQGLTSVKYNNLGVQNLFWTSDSQDGFIQRQKF